MFCRTGEIFSDTTKESVGVGDEEEKNIRSFVGSVMSVYEGTKVRVRVYSEWTEKFSLMCGVGIHQG